MRRKETLKQVLRHLIKKTRTKEYFICSIGVSDREEGDPLYTVIVYPLGVQGLPGRSRSRPLGV